MSDREPDTTLHTAGPAFLGRRSRALIAGIIVVAALGWIGAPVLHGAVDALYVHTNGHVGIGTTNPQATLDVAGTGDTDGEVSLQLRGGNSKPIGGSYQLAFGWRGTHTYRHAMKTRHNGNAADGNALDFYVWKPGGDAATQIGGLHTMSLNGGKVGIGTDNPKQTLDVVGTTSLGGPVTVAGKGDTQGQVSLQLRSGNSSAGSASSQLTFGYSGADTYRHAIKSRHNSAAVDGNAIDFYVWKSGGDATTQIGGLHTMSLNGGKVGIGTPTPQKTLDVVGTTSLAGAVSVTQDLTVTGAVNAGVMNGASSVALRTSGVNRVVIGDNTVDFPNGWRLATNASRLAFSRAGQEIMAINQGGDLEYNVHLPYYGRREMRSLFASKDGPSVGFWVLWSDGRLKTDVEPITSALEKVARLRGVVYRWSENARERFFREMGPVTAGPGEETRAAQERARLAEQLARPQVGLIAQEVESVVPEVVGSTADGYKVIQYGHLAAVLVEAVKEQHALVQAQRTELDALKAGNADLRAELASLRAQVAQLGAAVQRVTTTRIADRP